MISRQAIFNAVAVVLIAIVFAFSALVGLAIYGHRAAERAGNEAATIQNMKTIASIEAQYFYTHGRTFATLDQLVQEQLLSSKFAAHPVIADGFVITLKVNESASYTLAADPANQWSGKRHFYLDSASEQIHVNPDAPAGPNDPIL